MVRITEKKKKRSTTSMAAGVMCLPDDIMVDIMLRLSARSILRCRCVCMPWYTLTTDSSFIKKHHSLAIERADDLNIFIVPKPDTAIERDTVCCVHVEGGLLDRSAVKIGDPIFHNSKLVGSCNGLVCLVRANTACLLNPLTREYKILTFEKNFESYAVYGLGYDPTSDDYKLVQLAADYAHTPPDIYISKMCLYSIRDRSCLTISNIPYEYRSDPLAFYLNGALHWVARTKGGGHGNVLLVSFDMRENLFREVPTPQRWNILCTIAVLGTQLCMLYRQHPSSDVDVWVTENYGLSDSWIKLYSMKKRVVHSLRNEHPADCYASGGLFHLRPLCFTKKGEILLEDVQLGKDLILYDPNLKRAKNPDIQNIRFETAIIVTHVASLVSLNSGTYTLESGVMRDLQAYEDAVEKKRQERRAERERGGVFSKYSVIPRKRTL